MRNQRPVACALMPGAQQRSAPLNRAEGAPPGPNVRIILRSDARRAPLQAGFASAQHRWPPACLPGTAGRCRAQHQQSSASASATNQNRAAPTVDDFEGPTVPRVRRDSECWMVTEPVIAPFLPAWRPVPSVAETEGRVSSAMPGLAPSSPPRSAPSPVRDARRAGARGDEGLPPRARRRQQQHADARQKSPGSFAVCRCPPWDQDLRAVLEPPAMPVSAAKKWCRSTGDPRDSPTRPRCHLPSATRGVLAWKVAQRAQRRGCRSTPGRRPWSPVRARRCSDHPAEAEPRMPYALSCRVGRCAWRASGPQSPCGETPEGSQPLGLLHRTEDHLAHPAGSSWRQEAKRSPPATATRCGATFLAGKRPDQTACRAPAAGQAHGP